MMKMVLICLIGFGATNLLAQKPLYKDSINTDTIRSRRLSVLKIGYEIEGKDTLPVYLLSKFNFKHLPSYIQENRTKFKKWFYN